MKFAIFAFISMYVIVQTCGSFIFAHPATTGYYRATINGRKFLVQPSSHAASSHYSHSKNAHKQKDTSMYSVTTSDGRRMIIPLTVPVVPVSGMSSSYNSASHSANDYNINGNNLYYTSNRRAFLPSRTFEERNYHDFMNRKNINPYVSLRAPHFVLPSVGADDFDNSLDYQNNRRALPRTDEERYYLDAMNRNHVNSYLPLRASGKPVDQTMETDNIYISQFNPNLPSGGIYRKHYQGYEDDYGHLKTFDNTNYLSIRNRAMNPYIASSEADHVPIYKSDFHNNGYISSSKLKQQDNNLKHVDPINRRIDPALLGSLAGGGLG